MFQRIIRPICSLFAIVIVLAMAGMAIAGQAVAPPTLEMCIRTALARNPETEAALQRVEAARAAMKQAESAYYPWINLAGSYLRSDNPPQVFMMQLNQRKASLQSDFNNPGDAGDTRLSAGVKYRLFDGGRRGAERGMARSGMNAADAGLSVVQNELIYQVTRGYFSVLQAEAFRQVQRETVLSLEASLRVANERFAAGSVVKTDVLNLDVKLAQAREDLIHAGHGWQLAIIALNTAIGEDLVSSEGLGQPPDMKAPPAFQAAADAAVDNRPELKALQNVVAAREAAYSKAVRDYIPLVNAFGELDWDSAGVSDFQNSYTAGIVAEWEAFSGFRTMHGVREARAALAVARAELAAARNKLRLDIQQANLQARDSRERIEVTTKSVESAEEALRITSERYQKGSADITDLLTAQVGLTGTRTRDVSAHYDYLTALANVERAQGELVKKYTKTTER
jgi:outer membrane protein